MVDWTGVRDRVENLREKVSVFGSSSHNFELLPALSEAQVLEAENQLGVTFPIEYRTFLLEVGAGGAGPFYGIFSLVKIEGEWTWDGDGGDMSKNPEKPWRHDTHWNLDDHEVWALHPDEVDEELTDDEYDERYDDWDEKFIEVYWDYKWTEGGICLCHEGCALRDWLVVTGEQRGQIWWDGTADRVGLQPWEDKENDNKRITFYGWYMRWLEAAEKGNSYT